MLLVFCEGNPPLTDGLPSQRASNAENDSMEWHHHGKTIPRVSCTANTMVSDVKVLTQLSRNSRVSAPQGLTQDNNMLPYLTSWANVWEHIAHSNRIQECEKCKRSIYKEYFSNEIAKICSVYKTKTNRAWWRHQMATFSALLALCEGNSPVTGEFPSQRTVARNFDFLWSTSEQTVEQSIETPVLWDAIALIMTPL